jgi:hypothetical protein
LVQPEVTFRLSSHEKASIVITGALPAAAALAWQAACKLQPWKLTLPAGVASTETSCGELLVLVLVLVLVLTLLLLLLLLLGPVMILMVLLQLGWPISAWRLAGCMRMGMVVHSRTAPNTTCKKQCVLGSAGVVEHEII